jgi:hypothetical protein
VEHLKEASYRSFTPQKFRDLLPEPASALPPVRENSAFIVSQPQSPCCSPNFEPVEVTPQRTLESTKNVFGLYWCYFSKKFPTHDPENEAGISNLSSIVDSGAPSVAESFYGLYPNESSFRLGEWFWSNGTQKSESSFKELINIVRDEGFRPLDVQATNWDKINMHLTAKGGEKQGWLDEDAGWKSSSVRISVPFHRFAQCPGPQDYVVANFYHRSLVSVITEKLASEHNARFFHYEPYELLWQRPGAQNSVRIHGELYTSTAFLNAHNALQELPGEPGCNLPRVVVALMFWSDSTSLTNFGSAKLWPLYLFFGNESKYRRGKPSLNLCEHIAYLETVRFSVLFQSSVMTIGLVACLIQRFFRVALRQ